MAHKEHKLRAFDWQDRIAVVALTFGIVTLGWNIQHNVEGRRIESCRMMVNASSMTGNPVTYGQCLQILDHTAR